MLPTQYGAPESLPTAETEEPLNIPEDDDQPSPLVNPYIPKQGWTYLQYEFPLHAIIIFTLGFAGFVAENGQVPAPQWMASFAMSNPQVKAQLVTILATCLAVIMRWAQGGAAALLARKRLLRPRSVYELDMLFNLNNNSVICDWEHRKMVVLFTWFSVATCGLLTAGFVALLNPHPIEVQLGHTPAQEFNFAANITSQGDWDFTWMRYVMSGSRGTQDGTAVMSDIPYLLQSVTRKYLASKDNSKVHSSGSFVTSLKELGYTSFAGSTAGALITGASNFQNVTLSALPLGRPDYPSYSLDLQGTWINVSCSMNTAPPLNVTITQDLKGYLFWGDVINYRFTCPGSSAVEGVTNSLPNLVLTFKCPMENDTTAFFFKSLDPYSTLAVDKVSCSVSPQIGEVIAILNPSIQAFNVTKKTSQTISPSSATYNLTGLILEHVTSHFKNIAVMTSIEEAIHAQEIYFGKIEDETLLELMEMILSTIFEFEASYTRSVLNSALEINEKLPPRFAREVKVVVIDHTVGWEMKWTTFLGLIPVVIVYLTAFSMLKMARNAEGELTVFDPVNPVSILAATSVGDVSFPNQALSKTIGDPEDENVLSTKVSYAKKDGTWGLWSSERNLEVSVKYERAGLRRLKHGYEQVV